MNLSISHWIHIHKGKVSGSDLPQIGFEGTDPAILYHQLQYNYPKFFKMDVLCKWAWLGAEYLITTQQQHEQVTPYNIAVVLMSLQGCIDVDKKYLHSVADFPSPSLFVYTLPNIMLGEICIRHGIKGEQLCLVNESFHAGTGEIEFWVNDLLNNRGMDACICGWADATGEEHDVFMMWVTKQNGMEFSAANMQQLYNKV